MVNGLKEGCPCCCKIIDKNVKWGDDRDLNLKLMTVDLLQSVSRHPIQEWLDGDDVAFNDVFLRYKPYCAQIFRRMGVPNDHIDDLIQELFLGLHRGRARLNFSGGNPDGRLKAYLGAAAKNLINNFKKQRRTLDASAPLVSMSPGEDGSMPGEILSIQTGGSTALDRVEAMNIVDALIGDFSEDVKIIFKMRAAGYFDTEIASRLGTTAKKIKVLMKNTDEHIRIRAENRGIVMD